MASILILGGVLPLAVALLTQYVLLLPPCHFCLLQRYPYLVAIGMGVASLLVRRGSLGWRFAVAIGIAAFLSTALLGLIHSGIESGFLKYTGGCVAQAGGDSIDAIRAAITSAPLVSCSDKLAQFAGMSMAMWNVVFAAAMVVLASLQYRFDVRQHGI